MPNTPTVLVLGAGASRGYGYPLGGELRALILNMRTHTAVNLGIVGRGEEASNAFSNFQSEFRKSALFSIDAFLGRRRDFEEIGKRCIAGILLERESKQTFEANTPDDWYAYLLNEISVDSWDELDFSNLSVVTFNYDRSLEAFLLQSLVSGYGRSEEEVVAKLASLKIVHVYGSLGSTYPGQADYFEYGSGVGEEKITAAARHLVVIPEGRMDSETLVEARSWLRHANNIAFLGFGFDRTNVERLTEGKACTKQVKIDDRVTIRQIIGTCRGLRPLEISTAYQKLVHRQVERNMQDCDCSDLLRNTLILRD